MFKKIQKKLLLNYPLLWNVKVIPMGITVLSFNILFFFLGFISTSLDFQVSNYYYNRDSNAIFFLITGLTSILVLIIWLIYYLKNNSFKSFYPKKKNSLYWEWLLIFILIFGNCLYSFSYLQGVNAKERSYASNQEVIEVQRLLAKIELLAPDSDSNYYHRTIVADSAQTNNTSDSISISLLNFDKYSNAQDSNDIKQVKKWLMQEKKDSIRNLISQYLKLQKKHKLTSNLTVNSWMDLIYHPPTYTVSPSNYINKTKPYYENSKYYIEYDNLVSGYNKIYDAHNNDDFSNIFILVILYITLTLSILLFSFRVTSGKSWLTSLVIAGLLAFIYGIITAIYGILSNSFEVIYLAITYWLAIFFFMCFYVGGKIYSKDFKGKSAILTNLILWMIPYVLLLIYAGFITFSKSVVYYDKNYNPYIHIIYNFFDDYPTLFFWINLIFVIVILFFLMKFIKKFRALPEE